MQSLSPVLFSLSAMPVAEFKAVIEGPARRHSATVKPLVIAPRLTEQLVIDAQGADALPLLALTLEWLYREFTDAQGTRVGYDEYQRLGGVRGAIGMAVKRAFELPGSEPAIPAQLQEQERLLQQLFPYLATVDPDTGEWKRRVALRNVIRKKLPQADAIVSRLIEQRLLLADSRRIADSAAPVEVVEVAHEALLRQWDAMERWLREFGAALSASESIRRAANDWQRGKRDEVRLVHSAHRLEAAEALLSDQRLEGRFDAVDGEYIAACRQRDRRQLAEREEQLRRIAEQQTARAALQRRATWWLSTAALTVMGMLIWIVMQTREVSLQTSLVLASAAETAVDQKRFDQGLRFGVLATRASWLHPADATARAALSRAADASTLRTLFIDHGAFVNSASFSPDGMRVVTALDSATALIWDADSGKAVGEPKVHGTTVSSASFSADGKRVVTASGATARVWGADSGKAVSEPMTHGGNVPMTYDNNINSASFSADGTRVVTSSNDKTARIWDADSGKALGEPMTHDDAVNSASFSPDGQIVVTASNDYTARVWNAFWSSLIRPENLIDEACQRKLRGNVRKINEADVRAATILYKRVGEDVCAGVATVATR